MFICKSLELKNITLPTHVLHRVVFGQFCDVGCCWQGLFCLFESW